MISSIARFMNALVLRPAVWCCPALPGASNAVQPCLALSSASHASGAVQHVWLYLALALSSAVGVGCCLVPSSAIRRVQRAVQLCLFGALFGAV